MGAHSGRVFRTVLCGRRRGEWRRSLACRQTSVFRHGWISHTQDDSVHSGHSTFYVSVTEFSAVWAYTPKIRVCAAHPHPLIHICYPIAQQVSVDLAHEHLSLSVAAPRERRGYLSMTSLESPADLRHLLYRWVLCWLRSPMLQNLLIRCMGERSQHTRECVLDVGGPHGHAVAAGRGR